MSGLRCENPGCRGNAPCEACLMGLSAAIEHGIREAWPMRVPLEILQKRSPKRGFDAHVKKEIFMSVKKALDAYWARTIQGKGKR